MSSLSFILSAQDGPEDLLFQMEASIKRGEKRSLRDLGSLLDKSSTKKQAISLIRKYSLFKPEEINLDKPLSKATFHSFYYDYEKQIQFSELLGLFYISSLEDRKIKYETKPLNIQNEYGNLPINAIRGRIDQAITDNNQGLLVQQLTLLGRIQNDESSTQLLELSREMRQSSKKWSDKLYYALGQSLAQSRDLDCLKELLNLIAEKKISATDASKQLLVITNLKPRGEITSRNLLKTYRHYIDSLGTVEEMRAHGYKQIFNFQPNFFNHIVDYYGRILCFAGKRDWLISNAMQDLIATRHPRSLFYLTAMGYKNSQIKEIDDQAMSKMIKTISELTNQRIGVENVKESIDFDLSDESDKKALENYLCYWAANYDDYEWDEMRNCYVNKYNALEKTQSYEKLFRRLNSRNDSVAMASFAQLTEGEPSEIVALAEKYRQMFRSYNQSLPPFKYKYLEQLSTLTHYCRERNIPYKPHRGLSKMLDKLYTERNENKRYQLENSIIQSLNLNDITALEYWGCINQSSAVTNYSLGRILDVFYSKNWSKILNSDKELRLYLKKSQLLSNIGVIGVCNNYLNKFDLSNQQIEDKLNEIKSTETDRHILNQVAILISSSRDETDSALSDFIAYPLGLNKRDIKPLPPPNKKELKQVVKKIQSLNDNNAIKKLFFYLRLHPTIDHVPLLFELAKDERILLKRRGWEMTVADNVTPILETIFSFNFISKDKGKQFDISPWNDLWEKDKANFKKWPAQFFEQKITQLETHKTLSIDDINLITESPSYEAKYKYACLEALKKVSPLKDIKSLNIKPKLSLKDDLSYLESFKFSYKVLDDIPKLFEIDDPGTMLDYLIRKSEKYNDTEKGSLFNALFRYPWFATYVHSGQVKKLELEYLVSTLETYLQESDYLSEYEEQTTTLHVTQLRSIGMPLEERLLASIKLDVDKKSIAKIQETIISTISYEEIGLVAQHFNELTPSLGEQPWAFLRNDFGLPIFDLSDQKDLDDFLKRHKNSSENDFYLHYLQEFGIDFQTKGGKLDYQKIYEILLFDAVTPFVAGSGGKRDYHTYGIIKVLELKFKTSLDFHRKLNENQSFYTFSTAKRSEAWIDYLKEKNLIKVDNKMAPSFTFLIETALLEEEGK